MRLVRPSIEWATEHKTYVQEWGQPRMVPNSFSLVEHRDYEAYLEALALREKGEGEWMPCSNYFLVNSDNRIVGMLDIRHKLNAFLLQAGGHIGYSVRPSERRKGYATRILSQALLKCRELGIDRVLVTCDKDNIGSARTILNNNGVEDESFTEADGSIKRRFWIDNS